MAAEGLFSFRQFAFAARTQLVQCSRGAGPGMLRVVQSLDTRMRTNDWRLERAAVLGGVLIAVAAGVSAAQETDSARAERHTKAEASLAKAAQNPVANMISLPLQYNFYTGGGLRSTSEMVLNVQPVLPLPIGKKWLIVSRTVVPFTSVPVSDSIVVAGNPQQIVGFRAGGIADIQEQAYITSAQPSRFTWAIGPVFSFPTANNDLIRTGQWGLGPTAVALMMPDPWVIGVLVNNIWRIGGDDRGHRLNTFTLQPFINYNLAYAWAISMAPLITADWSAPNGQRWTVPIGAGISKVAHVGDQPMNFLLQYYHNTRHPRLAGSSALRMEVAFLWPTAAAKAKEKEEKLAREHGSAK